MTRIAVLVDQFPEVSETFIPAELHALRRQGARVRVEATGPAPHPDPGPARGLVVRFGSDDRRWERWAALAWLVRRAPRACAADLLARRRWRREEWPRRLRELAPVARRIAAAGDEHVHAHFGAGAGLDAVRLGALLGLPTSITFHGYDIFRDPRNLAEKLRRARFATSGSDFTVRALRAAAPGAAVHRVVMGVDAESWRRSTPVPERGPVVAVGRLVAKKGIAELLRAAALLTHAEVLVVGDGPLRAELEALRVELGLGERVRLLGARPSAEVRALLERAAVVAVPSVVARDGDADSMPVVAKEALALEVPVVSSDAAGLPEVVRPPWGLTIPAGDAEALAAALGDVLGRSAAERAAMGAAGRAWVAEHCSVDAEAARLLALIAAARA